jgi:uncharacterized protein YdhG (YjbR/CyaY superfamily)
MKRSPAVPKTIDEYIVSFPTDIHPLLKKIRATIKKAAPGVEEKISYQIPAFQLNGHYLIYFAAFKEHVGVYPAPISHPDFEEELAPYASGKATAKFLYNKPVPFALITKIVKFKVQENIERFEAKSAKKS